MDDESPPENMLFPKSKYCRFVRDHSEDGNDPLKELSYTFKFVSAVKSPMDEGRSLLNLFCSKYKYPRFLSNPREEGNDPLKELS
jgi:hypothetical protein